MELSVNDSSVTSIGIMVLAGKDGIIGLSVTNVVLKFRV